MCKKRVFLILSLLVLFSLGYCLRMKIIVRIKGEKYLSSLKWLDTTEIRTLHARRFFQYGNASLKFLYSKIKNGKLEEKEGAIWVLREITFSHPESEVLNFLVEKLIREKNKKIKDVIAWAVLDLIDSWNFSKEEIREAIWCIFSSGIKHEGILLKAIEIYSEKVGEGYNYLIYKFLKSNNPKIVRDAIRLLRKNREKKATPILKKLITSPNDEVKLEALVTLISFGNVKYIPECIKLFKKQPDFLFRNPEWKDIILRALPEGVMEYKIDFEGTRKEIEGELDLYLTIYYKKYSNLTKNDI